MTQFEPTGKKQQIKAIFFLSYVSVAKQAKKKQSRITKNRTAINRRDLETIDTHPHTQKTKKSAKKKRETAKKAITPKVY